MPRILTPLPVDTIDLRAAAERIRAKSSTIADLLDAVADVDEDCLHSMVEWPNGERECIDDCTPCAAKAAAQTVAARFLRLTTAAVAA